MCDETTNPLPPVPPDPAAPETAEKPPMPPIPEACQYRPSAPKAPKGPCCYRTALLNLLGFTVRIAIILVAAISLCTYLGVQGGSDEMSEESASGIVSEENVQYRVIGGGEDAEAAVAVVDVKGLIGKTGEVFFHDDQEYIGADSGMICLILEAIANDEQVKVIVLDMDTPGGEIVASDEIYHALKRCSAKGKKIVTCMGSVAASGGYFIACASDWIVANRLTTTGSIGVVSSFYNVKSLADLVGVKHVVFKSGAKKDLMDEFRDITPEESAFLQKQIDDCYQEFAAVVAENRTAFKTAEDLRKSVLGDARTVSGRDALKLGLVDELGYMHDAMDKARAFVKAMDSEADDPQIRRYWLETDGGDGEMAFEVRARRAVPRSVNLSLPLRGVSLQPGKLYAILPSCVR